MREYASLVGQRFGMFTVIEQAPFTEKGQRRWVCRCDCGNQRIVTTSNLSSGHSVSCGCRKYKNLMGQHIGALTVLERSDQYGTRGRRKVQLWKCRCDCGAITYKATDTLTNEAKSMCKTCASKYAVSKARTNAGFVQGTQVSKLKASGEAANNATGVKGVYYEAQTGRYRARIKFQGKLYSLGTYSSLEEAARARRKGDQEIFGAFLESQE